MTLLIDPPNSPGHGRLWSHLASDTSFDELHGFAAALGVPRRGFDRDHYDIPADRYDAVVAAGATPVTSRVLIHRLQVAGLRRRKGDALRPRAPGTALVRPRRLRPGDRVVVTAPAGPAPRQRLDAGLEVLRSWQLDVHLSQYARGCAPGLGYLAANDASRAADLVRAWCDPAVSAVVCARGGYGALRVLDLLDWQALAEAGPKVLVGFSDVTALHQAFAARLGLSTVHGPVVTSLGAGDAATVEQLRALLLDPGAGPGLTPAPAETLVPGRADGVLVGGNVALLAASAGTADHYPARGGIAVLEDVDELPFRLDRTLTQLLRSGWFDGVRGIALGSFTRCGDPALVRRVLLDRLGPLRVPMVADLAVGHAGTNLAFPLGVPAVLDADLGTGTLTLTRPGLR